MAKSYFAILGVSSDASPEEIRSAFRRLAKQFHPDRAGGDSGPFRQILEAYAVLSDARRRNEYEQSLAQARSSRRSGPARSFYAPFATPFEGLFEWLWDDFPGLGRPRSRRRQNVTLEVPLTREQARRGGKAKVMVPIRTLCPQCGGYGGIGYYECPQCEGAGVLMGELPFWVSFPPGLKKEHAVVISLARFGIRDFQLSVLFIPPDADAF